MSILNSQPLFLMCFDAKQTNKSSTSVALSHSTPAPKGVGVIPIRQKSKGVSLVMFTQEWRQAVATFHSKDHVKQF